MAPSIQVTGVLLLHTGSPDRPDTSAVRAYLRRFLMDPCVMDLPWPLRALIVHAFILPLRPRRSAALYRKIWLPEGAPLTVHTAALQKLLQERLPGCKVLTATAYGRPTLQEALDAFAAAGVERILAVPLFPQYAGATRGSLQAALAKELNRFSNLLAVTTIPPFHDDAGFLDAQAGLWRDTLAAFQPDHVVFSFHGLPLRQAARDAAGGPSQDYVAQCQSTAAALAARLGLHEGGWQLAWQSRFGRGWLEPALEDQLRQLAGAGVKRVAVAAPSFTTDCLETLEELGMRGRDVFLEAGGQDYRLLPCLNSAPAWADALAALIRKSL